jgi:hypothetical protein
MEVKIEAQLLQVNTGTNLHQSLETKTWNLFELMELRKKTNEIKNITMSIPNNRNRRLNCQVYAL